MNEEQYYGIRRQYEQIEESCYRNGIGVDEYYKILRYSPEELEKRIVEQSNLEKILNANCGD